ncbi:hypothetical protein D3C87_2112990 [compost metagenome]
MPLLPVPAGRSLERDPQRLANDLQRHRPLEVQALADRSCRRQQLVEVEREEFGHGVSLSMSPVAFGGE